jgi:hypothetical protein
MMTQKVRFGGASNSVRKAVVRKKSLGVWGAVIALCAAVLVTAGCNQTAGPDTKLPDTTVTIDRIVPLLPKAVVKQEGEDLAAVLQRLKAGLEDAGDTGYPDLTHYIIDLKDYGDTEYLAPTDGDLTYDGIVAVNITIKNTGAARKTITLKKTGADGTAYQAADQGSLFAVSEGVLLVFEGDITLDGLSIADDGINNTASVVRVLAYGRLEINDGVIISGNTCPRGGGILLATNSFFTMNGGSIRGHTATGTASSTGGGGGLYSTGTFVMNDGEIAGNTSAYFAGGLYSGGPFTLNAGTIKENTATAGGGVYLYANTLTMNGGSITKNTANGVSPTSAASGGGGISNGGPTSSGPTFIMTGGSITENESAIGFAADLDVFASSVGTPGICKISGTARIDTICLRYGAGTPNLSTTKCGVITVADDFIGTGYIAKIDLAANGSNAANTTTGINNWTTAAIPQRVLQIDEAYTGVYSAENLPVTRFELGRIINCRASPVTETDISGTYELARTTGALKLK